MSTPAADPFVATFWKWVADSDRQKNELLASEFPKHIHRVVKDYVQSAYEERSKWAVRGPPTAPHPPKRGHIYGANEQMSGAN